MRLSRLFKGKKKNAEEEPRPTEPKNPDKAEIDRGIYYLYLIVGAQVALVLGLTGVLMFVGKVISTPGWVFLLFMAMAVGGCVFVYRKAKAQFRKFRESFQNMDLSQKTYEISFMGGMLTMRVEQPHPSRTLLESAPPTPLLENGETIDAIPVDAIPVDPTSGK